MRLVSILPLILLPLVHTHDPPQGWLDSVKDLFKDNKELVIPTPSVDGDSDVPRPKERLQLKDCELLGCELVDGKVHIRDLGRTSYNVSDIGEDRLVAYTILDKGVLHDGEGGHSKGTKRSPLIVDTENGPVKGFYNHGMYRGVYHHLDVFRDNTPRAWLGIPFAKPPVKTLRFMDPLPFTENWSPKIRKMNQVPKGCPQRGLMSTSDDCLYLNVYAPSQERMKALDNKPVPVLFYLYGGGFNIGSNYMYGIYDGRYLTKHNDMILVVPNYRVGVSGFLYTGDGPNDIKGNMAIKDQVMAMEWVKKNIKNFGGDPDNVTIAGLSSGAMSVLIHLVSPKTPAKLFHKAIMLSTPFGQYSRIPQDMRQVSAEFAHNVSCTHETPKGDVVDVQCLQQLPLSRLEVKGSKEPDQWNMRKKHHRMLTTHYYWWTFIDGKVIPKDPLDMILAGEFKRVPILMGDTRDEMGYFSNFLSVKQLFLRFDLKRFFKKENIEARRDHFFGKQTAEFLRAHYPTSDKIKTNEDAAVALATDAMFRCPMVQMADLLAKEKHPVYVYELTQHADFLSVGRCSKDMACHAFDIPYMFRPQFLWLSKKEKQLSKQYIKYVVNFMNGNINKDVAVKWPVYSADQKEYLELSHECKVGKRLREQLCRDVWAKIGYKF